MGLDTIGSSWRSSRLCIRFHEDKVGKNKPEWHYMYSQRSQYLIYDFGKICKPSNLAKNAKFLTYKSIYGPVVGTSTDKEDISTNT